MSRHGCLPTTLKFTGWMIVLLQLVVFIPVVISISKVPAATMAYVDSGLYQHRKLIQDYPRLYVTQLFRHFEAHFLEKGIGDWDHSRWPQLLQDLDLLPELYKSNANQDHRTLSDFWSNWYNRTEAVRQQETALPLNSQVQITRELISLFDGVPGVVGTTGTIRYDKVLAAAQDIVDNQYDIYSIDRKHTIKRAKIKKYRVLAFFGLTVFDQFLDAVENQRGTRLVTKVPRTILLDPEPVADDHPRSEEVPSAPAQPRPTRLRPRPVPVQPLSTGPNVQPVQPQVANPTGGDAGPSSSGGLRINPIRVLSPLAMLNPGQVIAHQLLGQRTHLEVPQDTKNYINQLYTNPFIRNLIYHEYPALYLGEIFLHFQADFQKGIGTSHWPILLQDLGLLPERYHSTVTGDRVRSELRNAWHRWRPHLEAQPIGRYHQTLVRVPPIMASLFRQEPAQHLAQSGAIRYDYLVDEMQRYADECPVNDRDRANHLQNRVDSKFRFLAIYYLTVIDQFVQVAAHARALDGGGPLEGPHPRTEFLVMEAGGGTKRKATDQGDGGPSQGGSGKRSPGVAMRSMDGASNEPRVGHGHKAHHRSRKFKSGAKFYRGHGHHA